MAEVSYPSPAHNSRNVTDAEYERLSMSNTEDGVNPYYAPQSGDVVVPGAGLQVLVKAGTVANVRGFCWEAGTSDVPLSVSANSSGSNRYDWVVLRLDRSTWTVRAAVIEGTPGQGTPSMTNDTGDTGFWDVPLAYVVVSSGASTPSVFGYTHFIGSRIRPKLSSQQVSNVAAGEISFNYDRGEWVGFDGAESRTIYSDSGVVALSGGFSTWEQRDSCVGRRLGDVVSLRLSYRRVGSTFSSNDASGSKLATLPASLAPKYYQFYDVSFGNGAIATVRVQTNGEIWIEAPNKDVGVNRVFRQTMTYFI